MTTSPTLRNLREPVSNQPSTKNNACESAAGLLESGGLTRAPRITGSSVGTSYTQKRQDRLKRPAFVAFTTERARLRKLPGHCSRCAKPSDSGKGQCLACLAYQAKYRARVHGRDWKDAERVTPAQAIAAIAQLRKEMDLMQHRIAQMQREARRRYQREWNARKVLNKYADAYPTITKQELSEINHAYK